MKVWYHRSEEVKTMSTTLITHAQREAVEKAGGQPVELVDPVNRCSYVLLKKDAYERLAAPIESQQDLGCDIPEGILRSQDAFFRDLPELLKDESLRGQWVIYHGDERIGFAPKMRPLIEECLRRGLKRDEYDVFVVRPQSREPEEMEIVTPWI
jgi:hypothetical protein